MLIIEDIVKVLSEKIRYNAGTKEDGGKNEYKRTI